jgi:hypothetical protein
MLQKEYTTTGGYRTTYVYLFQGPEEIVVTTRAGVVMEVEVVSQAGELVASVYGPEGIFGWAPAGMTPRAAAERAANEAARLRAAWMA